MILGEPAVDEVRALLGQGMSHRKVSQVTGRARTTISRIAKGKPVGSRETGPGEIVPPDRRRRPIKCPRHGRVYPPCLACQIEGIKELKKLARTGLDVRDSDRSQ